MWCEQLQLFSSYSSLCKLPSLQILIESKHLKCVNRLLNHKQCASLFLTDVVYRVFVYFLLFSLLCLFSVLFTVLHFMQNKLYIAINDISCTDQPLRNY